MLQNRVLDATLRGGTGNRDQIKEDLNEAIKYVDAVTRPQVTSSVEVMTANQGDYSLKTDFAITDVTSIRDVTYTAQSGPGTTSLEEVQPSFIRELRQTSTASYWINCYAIDGLDRFMVYPATQAAGDTITIYYVPRPIDLVADSDVPTGVPPEFHELYELYAIQRSMRQSSPEYAAQYTQMFEHKLGEYRKWKNRRGNALARRAVVGRAFRRGIPHDNSADWRYR